VASSRCWTSRPEDGCQGSLAHSESSGPSRTEVVAATSHPRSSKRASHNAASLSLRARKQATGRRQPARPHLVPGQERRRWARRRSLAPEHGRGAGSRLSSLHRHTSPNQSYGTPPFGHRSRSWLHATGAGTGSLRDSHRQLNRARQPRRLPRLGGRHYRVPGVPAARVPLASRCQTPTATGPRCYRIERPRPGFSVEAVQTPARVNVTCVTPLGEEVASTS
jgi:hypothetical protein